MHSARRAGGGRLPGRSGRRVGRALLPGVLPRAWNARPSSDGLPKAFGQAWKALQKHRQQLYGTGIVLWLARSAFISQRLPALGRAGEAEAPIAKLPTGPERKATRREPITEVLQVELKVPPTVNYSLLHNARPFLDEVHAQQAGQALARRDRGHRRSERRRRIASVPLHRTPARVVAARRLESGAGSLDGAAPPLAPRAGADDALCESVVGRTRGARKHARASRCFPWTSGSTTPPRIPGCLRSCSLAIRRS